MTINEMRYIISKAYESKTWENKVNKMRDNQVIAIYYNLEKRGMLTNKIIKKSLKDSNKERYYQLSFFDLYDNLEIK